MESAGILRRLISGAYDLLLLLAVLFMAAFVFIFLFGSAVEPPRRYFFQAYLLVVAGAYFVWFWTRGGQTPAMKTWHLRLVTLDGQPLSAQTAWIRFLLATIGLAFFGAGWCWALLDRDGCLLHDRFSGTRLVLV